MLACLILVLVSSSYCVDGVGSRSMGGLIKKLIHFSESRAEITLRDQIWARIVQVLASRSLRVAGVSSRSTVGPVMISMQKYESTGRITPYHDLLYICWRSEFEEVMLL